MKRRLRVCAQPRPEASSAPHRPSAAQRPPRALGAHSARGAAVHHGGCSSPPLAVPPSASDSHGALRAWGGETTTPSMPQRGWRRRGTPGAVVPSTARPFLRRGWKPRAGRRGALSGRRHSASRSGRRGARRGFAMQIFVKTLTGKTITLEVRLRPPHRAHRGAAAAEGRMAAACPKWLLPLRLVAAKRGCGVASRPRCSVS